MNSQVPDQIKKLAYDPKIYNSIEKVGEKFGLHIDQIGELDVEVQKVLLGLSKSSDFVKNIIAPLGISGEDAKQIAEEINNTVFKEIRTSLKPKGEQEPETIANEKFSSIEKAGNFVIEHDHDEHGIYRFETPKFISPNYNTPKTPPPEIPTPPVPVVPVPKPVVEHPPVIKFTPQTPPTPPTLPIPSTPPAPPHKETLVEQMLRGATAVPKENIQRKPESVSTTPPIHEKPQPPANLPTIDPYREPPK